MRKVVRLRGRKKKIIALIVALLLIAGAVCGWFLLNKKEKVKEPEKEKEVVKEPEKVVQIVDVNSTSRPFAVMINNISTARPLQSGLQDAYIMYEMIVEGGITRYLALFMDQNTERIGSIRSARHYYIDYALENDAIYVHHGQSPQATRDFSALGVDRISVSESSTGWRDKSLHVSSEHTLFTSIAKLQNGIGNKRTTRNKDLLLKYSAEEIDLSKYENAQVADIVNIQYSKGTTSNYEYDKDNKVYKRSVNNKPHKDYVTGEQYTFKNIITYKVRNYPLNDGSGKDRQTIENVGSGSGYYITNGYAVPIKWEKTSRSAQTKYTLENGEELVVNDGNTFIQIQPTNQSLTITQKEVVENDS